MKGWNSFVFQAASFPTGWQLSSGPVTTLPQPWRSAPPIPPYYSGRGSGDTEGAVSPSGYRESEPGSRDWRKDKEPPASPPAPESVPQAWPGGRLLSFALPHRRCCHSGQPRPRSTQGRFSTEPATEFSHRRPRAPEVTLVRAWRELAAPGAGRGEGGRAGGRVVDYRSRDLLERRAESGGPDAGGAVDKVRSRLMGAEGGAVLGSGQRGGSAVLAGVAGSSVRAVQAAGAVSLQCLLPLPVPTPGPQRGPGRHQAVARSLNPLSAQSLGFGRSSPSSPRPGPTPTNRCLSFPGRLLPPVHPSRDSFSLAGSLTVPSAESEGTPVVAADWVVLSAPGIGLDWRLRPRSQSRLGRGAGTSRTGVGLGQGAVFRGAETWRLVLTFAPWLRAKLWAWD